MGEAAEEELELRGIEHKAPALFRYVRALEAENFELRRIVRSTDARGLQAVKRRAQYHSLPGGNIE